MYNFILKRRPLSFNNTNGKVQYGNDLRSAFSTQNPTANRLTNNLYAIIYYFYNEYVGLDADNLSKPVWDHLSGLAYDDDEQIKIRTAGSFDLEQQDIDLLNFTGLSGSVVTDLLDAFDNEDHIVYIEMGKFNESLFRFNIE